VAAPLSFYLDSLPDHDVQLMTNALDEYARRMVSGYVGACGCPVILVEYAGMYETRVDCSCGPEYGSY